MFGIFCEPCGNVAFADGTLGNSQGRGGGGYWEGCNGMGGGGIFGIVVAGIFRNSE